MGWCWLCRHIFQRSSKRRETLFQKSSLLFLTWREYFYSQPKSKDLNKVTRPCIFLDGYFCHSGWIPDAASSRVNPIIHPFMFYCKLCWFFLANKHLMNHFLPWVVNRCSVRCDLWIFLRSMCIISSTISKIFKIQIIGFFQILCMLQVTSNRRLLVNQSCNEVLQRSALQRVYYGSGTCINRPLH